MLGFSTNELPFGIQNWQWKSQADLMDECTNGYDMFCPVVDHLTRVIQHGKGE